MDAIADQALADALAHACADAASQDFQSVASVASALRTAIGDDDDPIRALMAGLEYHLTLDEERRSPHGPFGPMMEAGGRSYPASLREIDGIVPGVYGLWQRAIRHSPLALVRARFADLLWEARYGDRPHEFAQQAIDAYTEGATDDFGHPVELSEAIQRAIEVASQINDRGRREAAIRAAVILVETSIASEERTPGVALPLLELFVNDRPERRPPELESLLQAAVDRFGDDPWNLESALELQARLSSPDELAELRRREVEAFRELAGRTAGLVRYAHLQHAIQLAEQHGLRPLANDLRRQVEALPEEDLGLKMISAEVTIPRDQIETFVDWFVGDDSIEKALTRLGSHLPTGDPEDNRQFVEQLMAEHPLQFLFTRMTLGPEYSLIRSTVGEDDQAEQALIDHETQRASIFSVFAVEILHRIEERYGPIADAVAWFESDLIEPAVALTIGRATTLFAAGDPDAAASVLAPRLERVVRRVAAAVGLTVTRSPDSRGRSGGVKGLGELLGQLEDWLQEPTRRYLKVLLSEVTGLNLRNRIGHGLSDEISHREAALLIHAACHLRLLAPAGPPDPI